MRKIIITILMLVMTTECFCQQFFNIKDNNNSDKTHRNYPSYIEIDTTLIKDLNTVIVYYNSEQIKYEGNRFYLSSNPKTSSNSSLDIRLTEKGKSDLKKITNNDTKKKTRKTTKELNEIFIRRGYKLFAKDTILLNEKYEAFFEVDTNLIKNANNFSVLINDSEANRTGNKFAIEYTPLSIGENEYSIKITSKEKFTSENTTLSHYVFVIDPTNKSHKDFEPQNTPFTNQNTQNYIIGAQVMPKFNSNKFKSFNDYFIQSLQKEQIKLHGKILVSYTVMIDGSTHFEGIKQGIVTDTETERIKIIIEKYKDWTPGIDNGKPVNVNINPIFDFK